jgi:putative intracellular protease/amidase
MVVANPATSTTTGWPVGSWASELVHPLYEFSEAGYDVTVASPGGGPVEVMPWRFEDALCDRGANYVQGGFWKAFAIRDGRLITGQQQYSGRRVAALAIKALGA